MSESLAIRTTEEIKNLFYKLSEESNKNNNSDFLKLVLDSYNLQQAKQEVDILKPTIDTIQQLFTQINNCLIGASANIKANENKYVLQLEEEKKNFNNTIQVLQNKINLLEERQVISDEEHNKLQEENKNLHNQLDEYKKQLRQFDDIIKNKNEIIEEYKQKNDENLNIIKNLTPIEKEKNACEYKLQQKDLEIKNLKKEVEKIEKNHTHEVEKIKSEFELKYQKEIIKISQEKEKQLNDLLIKYDATINSKTRQNKKEPKQKVQKNQQASNDNKELQNLNITVDDIENIDKK